MCINVILFCREIKLNFLPSTEEKGRRIKKNVLCDIRRIGMLFYYAVVQSLMLRTLIFSLEFNALFMF